MREVYLELYELASSFARGVSSQSQRLLSSLPRPSSLPGGEDEQAALVGEEEGILDVSPSWLGCVAGCVVSPGSVVEEERLTRKHKVTCMTVGGLVGEASEYSTGMLWCGFHSGTVGVWLGTDSHLTSDRRERNQDSSSTVINNGDNSKMPQQWLFCGRHREHAEKVVDIDSNGVEVWSVSWDGCVCVWKAALRDAVLALDQLRCGGEVCLDDKGSKKCYLEQEGGALRVFKKSKWSISSGSRKDAYVPTFLSFRNPLLSPERRFALHFSWTVKAF